MGRQKQVELTKPELELIFVKTPLKFSFEILNLFLKALLSHIITLEIKFQYALCRGQKNVIQDGS